MVCRAIFKHDGSQDAVIFTAIKVNLPQPIIIYSRSRFPVQKGILIRRLGGAGPRYLTDGPEGFSVDAMFYREIIIVYFSSSGPVKLDFFSAASCVEVDELNRERKVCADSEIINAEVGGGSTIICSFC